MAASCNAPMKQKFSRLEAKQAAVSVNRTMYDGRAVRPYQCPAGHWHIGHPPVGRRQMLPGQRRRK